MRRIALGIVLMLLGAARPQTQASRPVAKSNCFTAVLKLVPPAGYRYPTESDVNSYWAFFREEYNRQASCNSADLNGDGVADYVSFAISTSGPGFAVVILYSSGKTHYEPRIAWADSGSFYHAANGIVETVARGRRKLGGCSSAENVNVTLPAAAVDYFNREPGTDAKHEHRLFWSTNKGVTISQRDLCPAER